MPSPKTNACNKRHRLTATWTGIYAVLLIWNTGGFQKAPCNCELVDGKELHQGEKLERQMQVCEETDAIEPLELVEVSKSDLQRKLMKNL